MLSRFDRRVVPESILEFIRRCQKRAPCRLGGGAALAGAYLAHRMTGDLDLFFDDADRMRGLVGALPEVASAIDAKLTVLRDVGYLVRARLESAEREIEVDVVHDPVPDVETPPAPLEGVVVKSLADLRASKLTCILSRSEPRDLVDLYFLERAGHPSEQVIDLALRKDAGTDPGVLAWLLSQFPTQPLPEMLEPLTTEELEGFRRQLSARLRALSTTRK